MTTPASTDATTTSGTTATAPAAGAGASGTGGAPPPLPAGAAASPPPPAAEGVSASAGGESGPPGGARQKGGDTDTAKPPASPPELTLALPEGFAETDAATVRAYAKEHGLKPEAAQKLVDTLAARDAAAKASYAKQLETIEKGWVEGLKADPDFGGTAYEANVQTVKKALARYSTQEERAGLTEAHLADFPIFVRILNRVGKEMSEDSVAGVSGAPVAASDDVKLRRLYPNTPGLFSNA